MRWILSLYKSNIPVTVLALVFLFLVSAIHSVQAYHDNTQEVIRGFDPETLTATYYELDNLNDLQFTKPYEDPIDFYLQCFKDIYPYSNCKLIPQQADGDTYSVQWNGDLITPQIGMYTFSFANVDDGVQLYIDGTLVVDQGWNYPFVDTSPPPVTLQLTPGRHTIVINYEQRFRYVASLQVRWAGPGFDGEVIPLAHANTTGKPVLPNCLGTYMSETTKDLIPLGQVIAPDATDGGYGEDILAYLQGAYPGSCPDGGFPTPL